MPKTSFPILIAIALSGLAAKGQAVAPDPAPRIVESTPRAPSLPEPANPNLPSLILIGDSTVRNGRGDGRNGQWGWGDLLPGHFDSASINVVNRALGGTSSRTYYTMRWAKSLAFVKRGDFVMMQFGHNDGGPLDDTSRARGTLPGTGEETREIDNPITGKHEVVHTYGWYLRQFIAESQAKGATPVVCSLVPRKMWNGDRIRRSDDYAKWAHEAAISAGVAFIDLNEIVARRYDELGPEKVEFLFADEHTHTSRSGAELNAESLVAWLKSLEPNPLGKYLK